MNASALATPYSRMTADQRREYLRRHRVGTFAGNVAQDGAAIRVPMAFRDSQPDEDPTMPDPRQAAYDGMKDDLTTAWDRSTTDVAAIANDAAFTDLFPRHEQPHLGRIVADLRSPEPYSREQAVESGRAMCTRLLADATRAGADDRKQLEGAALVMSSLVAAAL